MKWYLCYKFYCKWFKAINSLSVSNNVLAYRDTFTNPEGIVSLIRKRKIKITESRGRPPLIQKNNFEK